ncbi:acetyl-CoA carboxylase biotin carboxyl carrier protein [Amycolatopsis circi]|uniref:acetyl-CoA carboxylase biotin carboxyl carrier protein n=1 Tax=Amycolatopsis circi TaxID=871959 RepID=UPI000E22625D|nr:biotin/lipoyl-containing protein [Amycolatopsis circi]
MTDHESTTENTVQRLVEVVCTHASGLLSGVRHPPAVLRLRAADVAVELEWPVAANDEQAAAGPVAADPAGDPADDLEYLLAQTVGVFYHAPEPGAPPFVSEGDVIVPGRQVGIIEAMKMMIPVEADRRGRIAAVLTENGASVEYGARLFALAQAG